MKIKFIDRLKPLIEAIERGEILQKDCGGSWHDYYIGSCTLEELCVLIEYNALRVKPRPREWWLGIDPAGNYFGSMDGPNEFFNVHVREVLKTDDIKKQGCRVYEHFSVIAKAKSEGRTIQVIVPRKDKSTGRVELVWDDFAGDIREAFICWPVDSIRIKPEVPN